MILLVNTQINKYTNEHCRTVPSDGVFCVFVFFRWFFWNLGHTNAQMHKYTNSCSRLIKSSASLIEITHFSCDGRRIII